MNFKKQLEYFLQKHNMNATQLSRKTGVPRQTIANWMAAQIPKNVNQVKKVADLFEVTIDELFFGSNNNKKPNQTDLLPGRYEIRIIKHLPD